MADQLFAVVSIKSENVKWHGALVIEPKTYLLYNEEESQCYVKYPEPPFTDEFISEVAKIIKNLSPAPKDWNFHKCFIKQFTGTLFTYKHILPSLILQCIL